MRRALVLATVFVAPIFSPIPAARASSASGSRAPDIVQIKTSDGQTLEGSFYKPVSAKPVAGDGKTPKAPGVLLIHGAGGTRAQLEQVADKLSKAGFGVLSFDLRGHGKSQSPELNWEKLSEADRKATWELATKDIDAAAHWLLEQPTIHSTSLSLVAYSSGCALAVRHAKSDEYVLCMALLAPNAQDYGYDVQEEIRALNGLPIFVVTTKDAAAEKMAEEANASSGGQVVDVFLSAKLANPLEDKQTPAKVVDWVGGKALPKRGRG